MKLLAFMLIIASVLAVTTITPNTNICTCAQIQYMTDCQAASIPNTTTPSSPTLCTWVANATATGTQAKGTCQTATATTTTTTAVATYCSGITVALCPTTLGCALPDGKTCQAFTGCSAYVFTTNAACQAVSNQCTTDGTQCATKVACSTYTTTIANCGLYSSSSGTGTCKSVSGACLDQTCSDAPTTMTTDVQCNAFLATCVSSGAGCVNSHVSCSTLTGSATTCVTQLGLTTEGLCKYSGTGTACAPRTCADAPATMITNAACIANVPSCPYTNGKGCVATAMTCSQLSFALGCSGLVNSSGVACINDTSVTPSVACREIVCTDNAVGASNTICNAYLSGCVSNGIGCVTAANQSCSLYTGTTTTCVNYMGSLGPCKGSAATSGPCVPKTCADAPITAKTNTACAAIQTGCVTNGYGCVSSLTTLCANYTPTTTLLCDGYLGSDGPCTLITGQTTCSLRTCAGASTTTVSGVSTTSNAGCQAWFPVFGTNPGCVSNGTACVAAGACNTLARTSCIGYSTCSFPQSCVSNTACSNYQTQSMCISNTGAFQRACIWGSGCTITPCPTTTGVSDATCQGTTTLGCYYIGTGTGCVDGSLAASTCGSFQGTNSFDINVGCAKLFNGVCASSNPLSATLATCVARTCANFYQATASANSSVSLCSSWLAGCIPNQSTGCLIQYDTTSAVTGQQDICASYYGTQSTCNAIFANTKVAPGTQCWSTSTTVVGVCTNKLPSHIVQGTVANQVWTDASCAAQLAGTISSQLANIAAGASGVCVSATQACTSFIGTMSQCQSYTGSTTSGRCTKLSLFCYAKTSVTCNTQTGSSVSACQAISNTCTWVTGSNCTNLGPCSGYSGIAASCNAAVDQFGLPCGQTIGSASVAACNAAQFCTDYSTLGVNSTNAVVYCATKKDQLGNTCSALTTTDANCSYNGTASVLVYPMGVSFCTNPKIYVGTSTCFTPAAATCASLTGPTFISIAACQSTYITGCTWVSGTACISVGACTSTAYTFAAAAPLIAGCATLTNATGITCIAAAATVSLVCAEAPASCTSITATQVGTLSYALCNAQTNAAGTRCGFLTAATTCSEPVTCASAAAVTGDTAGWQQCAAYQDIGLKSPCNKATLVAVACSAGFTSGSCTQFNAVGTAAADNITVCQTLFIGTQKCGYVTSATTCSNRACTDAGITIANCATYMGSGCYWNGTACAAFTRGTCSSYTGNALAICNVLTDLKGRKCDWKTPGTTCIDQTCANSGAAATNALCQTYDPACTGLLVSASTCQTIKPSCYHYVAVAADCVQMVDINQVPCVAPVSPGTSCTYGLTSTGNTAVGCTGVNPFFVLVVGTSCTNPMTVCTAQTPTSTLTFAQKMAFCQTYYSTAFGTKCFYSVGTPTCVDTQTAPNVPACTLANSQFTNSAGVTSSGFGTEADCNAFSTGCTATVSLAQATPANTACAVATCDMNTTATSNALCQTFLSTCLWNGTTGCISQASLCAAYTGTVASCATFVGGFGTAATGTYGMCYQPTATAITALTAAACVQQTCANAPTTATSDAACEAWWPSIYNNLYRATTKPGPNLNCVYNGTTCVAPQVCASFTGTALTCPKFTATDGPCKLGTGTACAQVQCADAPNTYITDTQCALSTFANSSLACITTGYGCISRANIASTGCVSLQSSTVCTASLLGGSGTVASPYVSTCAWLGSCVSQATTCASLTTSTSCLTTPITPVTTGTVTTTPVCAWDQVGLACRNQTCTDLAASNTTHAACNALISTCTTKGAGCITLGNCASYTSAGQTACLAANNVENSAPLITKCFWTGTACRVVQCTDNTTATSTSTCNQTGLTNCVTTGAGCVTVGSFQCSQLTTASVCLVDGSGSPCLWVSGACYSYTSCASIPWSTYSQCQRIITNASFAPLCTSNGSTCIGLNSCANYVSNSVSCQVSNAKNTCGLLPANSKSNVNAICQNFGACTDALGTTNATCQLYGATCISNGTSCQVKSACSTYSAYACANNSGTDGACIWQAVTATILTAACRTQVCTDAAVSLTTDAACASFAAPIINQCTTTGAGCTPRLTCGSYTTLAGCVQGTDGACIWIAPAATSAVGTLGTCRVKLCPDSIFTSSAACASSTISSPATSSIAAGVVTTVNAKLLACVSNGTACIPKAACSTYVNQAACQYSGTDGNCAFTPGTNATTPTIGTCALFTTCVSANSDQVACSRVSDRCYFSSTTVSTTTTTSCNPITCAQIASGTTCRPVPSIDLATYSLCAPVSSTNSTCIAQDGSANPASLCFSASLGQYTWNDTSTSCTFCGTVTTTPNTTNTTNTTTTYGSIISGFLLYGALIAIN